jgi:hypothetical protein
VVPIILGWCARFNTGTWRFKIYVWHSIDKIPGQNLNFSLKNPSGNYKISIQYFGKLIWEHQSSILGHRHLEFILLHHPNNNLITLVINFSHEKFPSKKEPIQSKKKVVPHKPKKEVF